MFLKYLFGFSNSMTITFYLGPEYTTITKKFKKIKQHYKSNSNSDCFRHIVNILYKEIMRLEK